MDVPSAELDRFWEIWFKAPKRFLFAAEASCSSLILKPLNDKQKSGTSFLVDYSRRLEIMPRWLRCENKVKHSSARYLLSLIAVSANVCAPL